MVAVAVMLVVWLIESELLVVVAETVDPVLEVEVAVAVNVVADVVVSV